MMSIHFDHDTGALQCCSETRPGVHCAMPSLHAEDLLNSSLPQVFKREVDWAGVCWEQYVRFQLTLWTVQRLAGREEFDTEALRFFVVGVLLRSNRISVHAAAREITSAIREWVREPREKRVNRQQASSIVQRVLAAIDKRNPH